MKYEVRVQGQCITPCLKFCQRDTPYRSTSQRYIMSYPLLESSGRNAALSGPHPLPFSNVNAQPSPERTTLNDIPTEVINEIADCLRAQQWHGGGGCACQDRKKRIAARPKPFRLPKAPIGTWTDPSWAFSCASKRYRDVVFHGNTTRKYTFGFSKCCIKRVQGIPENIRASVS
jgi:hypothetical protein